MNQLNFSNKIIENTDFSNIVVPYINFKNSVLKKVKFKNAQINFINLQNTTIEDSDFSFSVLKKSVISNANIYNCNFNGSNLSESNLRRTIIQKSNFNNANLSSSDIEFLIFKNSILDNIILDDVHIGWTDSFPDAELNENTNITIILIQTYNERMDYIDATNILIKRNNSDIIYLLDNMIKHFYTDKIKNIVETNIFSIFEKLNRSNLSSENKLKFIERFDLNTIFYNNIPDKIKNNDISEIISSYI